MTERGTTKAGPRVSHQMQVLHLSAQGASSIPVWNLFGPAKVLIFPRLSSTGSDEMQQHMVEQGRGKSKECGSVRVNRW